MLTCFTKDSAGATPVYVVHRDKYQDWLNQQPETTRTWLSSSNFKADANAFSCIPDASGRLKLVLCCVADENLLWNVGALPLSLPEGEYKLEVNDNDILQYAIAWGLGSYQFVRYKKALRKPAVLSLTAAQIQQVENVVESIYLVRDWINTPADDFGPTEFADCVKVLAKNYKADFSQIIGEDLLKNNYATIYTVGRASDDAPRLLDFRWGDKKHPKLTLVGKGVCFDTGGLDIKPSSGMLLMKKDMGGGAHVFGLARMIMEAKLPVCLRVLVPAVENAVSGNAYRPGDVITTRKGLTVEIGNTDAEGRLVLADALVEAASETPDLLIDMSTLTGAARIALGADLPAMFANNDEVADAVLKHGRKENDPVWRMPLFASYRESLNSTIADINNAGADSYGGAITAALFLKEFVPDHIPWLHFDLMGWNLKPRPGRPQGGEAMALRALFSYLRERYYLDRHKFAG